MLVIAKVDFEIPKHKVIPSSEKSRIASLKKRGWKIKKKTKTYIVLEKSTTATRFYKVGSIDSETYISEFKKDKAEHLLNQLKKKFKKRLRRLTKGKKVKKIEYIVTMDNMAHYYGL